MVGTSTMFIKDSRRITVRSDDGLRKPDALRGKAGGLGRQGAYILFILHHFHEV